MVNVGLQENFIDTQFAVLTNVTDNLTYTQLTDLIIDIDSGITKHQLTDDTVDNIFSLRMNSLQGNMWVTSTEWGALVLLTKDVAGVRPKKQWSITWTDQSGVITTTTFNAQMKSISPIDSGIGAIRLSFKLEGDGSVIVT